MRTRTILFLFMIPLTIILVGCNSSNDKEVLRFGYASNSPPVVESMKKFGKLVEEKTNGEVVVEYYPDGQLGGERELIELTQTGAISITKVSGAALESFSNIYSIFGIPYLFDSEEHFYQTMENEGIMTEIYESTLDIGLRGLTYYDSGARNFYMKDKPIHSPDDLKGMKIRVMQSDIAIQMIKLLGGSPTPIGSDEVYTSLQQGILDGAENNEFVLDTAGHGEVTKYYSYDEHTRVPDIIVINDDVYSDLSQDHQQAIMEAAKESTEYQIKLWHQAVEDEKKIAIEKHNVQFNEVDKEPFREAVQPIHKQFSENPMFKDLYYQIRDNSDE
ncbi:TRAP transporter substrate-binding protein [Pseudogracilibacillus sp. SO10305]|uniref:TRAP transporter substrate-binding protein n=1 Tax=Pseudogracilibacillus sp. SO10305 TaxID=3098292 RepID=UPI00300E0AD4